MVDDYFIEALFKDYLNLNSLYGSPPDGDLVIMNLNTLGSLTSTNNCSLFIYDILGKEIDDTFLLKCLEIKIFEELLYYYYLNKAPINIYNIECILTMINNNNFTTYNTDAINKKELEQFISSFNRICNDHMQLYKGVFKLNKIKVDITKSTNKFMIMGYIC